MIYVTISTIIIAIAGSFFLGKLTSERKLLRGWFRKGVEREKMNEKITNKYRSIDRAIFNGLHINKAANNKTRKT